MYQCDEQPKKIKAHRLRKYCHGLQPLRGSVVLEQIDLALNKQHESSTIEPEPSISEEVVLPILDSIVDADQNVLKHLQLPKKWRKKGKQILTTLF